MQSLLVRLAFVVVAAGLTAACETTGSKPEVAVAAAPAAPDDKGDAKADAKPDSKADAKPDAKPDPKPAARTASRAGSKPAADQGDDANLPLTRPEAAGQCWMKVDRVNAALEKKADLVEKCIDERLAADRKKRGQ